MSPPREHQPRDQCRRRLLQRRDGVRVGVERDRGRGRAEASCDGRASVSYRSSRSGLRTQAQASPGAWWLPTICQRRVCAAVPPRACGCVSVYLDSRVRAQRVMIRIPLLGQSSAGGPARDPRAQSATLHAALAVRADIDPAVVSECLGHATAKMRYGSSSDRDTRGSQTVRLESHERRSKLEQRRHHRKRNSCHCERFRRTHRRPATHHGGL